jgi:hypothetical protein
LDIAGRQVLGDPGRAEDVHVVGQRCQVLLLISLGDREVGLTLVALERLVQVGFDSIETLCRTLLIDHGLESTPQSEHGR